MGLRFWRCFWRGDARLSCLCRGNDLAKDAVMQRLMELDGIDFLLKGAESLGAWRGETLLAVCG